MAVKDTYLSIAELSEGLFKDNGSRFIAKAYPVETEEEIKQIVASIRKEYHDARHHCYAWRLGLDGAAWRANDDGEPSGSAGRPILGQIDSAGLSDVLVVVLPAVMKTVKDLDLPQRNQSFMAECSLEVRIRRSLEQDFLESMERLGIFVG